ncbi:hypothetical protein FH972_002367 [Carpinus fangiana]|uniref:Uncharacterized protein n=1 Tax=Carpinus fangiana TaxID=176857 RepID=A0A5N6QHT9_9ROSI|nr:hypothetical protein FH972_002367 [Carpinus fangiana]
MSVQTKAHNSSAANAVIILVLLISSTKGTLGAARPLGDKKTTVGGKKVLFPEDRGPVPPSAPDPCTYIPKPGNGHCNK